MKKQDKYQIDIAGLSTKKHHFQFKVNDAFFVRFKSDIIQNGDLKVGITIDKSETMLHTFFDIKGNVGLQCDRTLEDFQYPVAINKEIFFKYGEEFEELSEDVTKIPKNLAELDLSQYIFEYIILSLPTKRLHPKFANETEEEDGTEEHFFYSTSTAEDIEDTKEEENKIDNRWDVLKKLKTNNKGE